MPHIEIRDNSVFISGFVNITEKESHFLNEDGKKFKEIILPKAFEKALSRAADVSLLFNHEESRQLGSLTAGNVKLLENEIGLKIEAEIQDSTIVQKVKENRSFLNGWSFGFIQRAESWRTKDNYKQRLISDLDLIEVSLLGGMTKPAYPSATAIEVRSDGMLERRFTNFETQESNVDFSIKEWEQTLKYLNLKGMYL